MSLTLESCLLLWDSLKREIGIGSGRQPYPLGLLKRGLGSGYVRISYILWKISTGPILEFDEGVSLVEALHFTLKSILGKREVFPPWSWTVLVRH